MNNPFPASVQLGCGRPSRQCGAGDSTQQEEKR